MTRILLAAAIAAAFSTNVLADPPVVTGPMAFNPIAGSAYAQGTSDPLILNSQPWVIPEGYSQHIISDESALNIYSGMSDWTDMNTVNEGKNMRAVTCTAPTKFARVLMSLHSAAARCRL